MKTRKYTLSNITCIRKILCRRNDILKNKYLLRGHIACELFYRSVANEKSNTDYYKRKLSMEKR